jgi:hypothetical protein
MGRDSESSLGCLEQPDDKHEGTACPFIHPADKMATSNIRVSLFLLQFVGQDVREDKDLLYDL